MSSNIIHSNNKYARDIGFDYGHADNTVQAALFNGLAQGFKSSTGGDSLGDSLGHNMQLSYMVDGLSDTAKKFITDLAESVEALGDY